MSKFQIGDKVRIKDLDIIRKIPYGGISFNIDRMRQFCGQIATIVAKSRFSDDFVKYYLDNIDGIKGWVWDERWLDIAVKIDEKWRDV